MKLYIKLERKIIKFGDIEIKKQYLHQCKRPVNIKIDINETINYH